MFSHIIRSININNNNVQIIYKESSFGNKSLYKMTTFDFVYLNYLNATKCHIYLFFLFVLYQTICVNTEIISLPLYAVKGIIKIQYIWQLCIFIIFGMDKLLLTSIWGDDFQMLLWVMTFKCYCK